jgi:hypothetical protein
MPEERRANTAWAELFVARWEARRQPQQFGNGIAVAYAALGMAYSERLADYYARTGKPDIRETRQWRKSALRLTSAS